ncbi:ASCH domain-containing protein [Halalkalicoccus tibetensis]|uniref:ASCH domain-containing protein n=1 Tax=Halalkalicoccus tibetensis TaxID=175632 RepID=A0ABD5V039_9EURY
MGEIDPDALLPNDHVKSAVKEGEVTQLSRGATNRYAEEGDTFELDDETFAVVDVEERTLGELTDEDARREGSADLESYRERMVAVHGSDFEWDGTSEIVSYRFERR